MWAGRASGWRRYQRWRHAAGRLARSNLVSRGTTAVRFPSSANRVFHVEHRRPGGPGRPQSPPATPVSHARSPSHSIPRILSGSMPVFGAISRVTAARSTTGGLAAAFTQCSGGEAAIARIAVAKDSRGALRPVSASLEARQQPPSSNTISQPMPSPGMAMSPWGAGIRDAPPAAAVLVVPRASVCFAPVATPASIAIPPGCRAR